MFTKYHNHQRGFTLIELMIVVVIIGVLAALAVPRFMTATTKAKQSEAKQILKQIYEMQAAVKEDTGVYGDLGQTRTAGGFFPETGVDIMINANYVYSITASGGGYIVLAEADPGAGGTDIDGDATVDTWRIDDTGNLQNTIDDVVL